jgi:hypothetical protein
MHINYHYETVSEAIEELRKKGYTTDFNLEENCIVCHAGKFYPDQFEVAEVYRYEGESDPGDEATVYGIQSRSGLRGVLVMGDETTMDRMTEAMVMKLVKGLKG